MKRNVDENGNIYWSIRSNGKEYRYYEDSMIYPSDVWDDISHLQQKDPERTGYDTQKPEALLERIILSTSQPGDWVGDFFAGSGTTLAVAQKNGRKWLAMDSSLFSMQISRKRLLSSGGSGTIAFIDPYLKTQEYNRGNKADISINASNNGETEIRLNNYTPGRSIDGLNYLDYIDFWSAGRLVNNEYIAEKYSCRTRGNPRLDPVLAVSVGKAEDENERIAVNITDIYGEQTLILL